MQMRILWTSRVRLLTTARTMTLIAIADRDDGATVHQGDIRGSRHGPVFILPFPDRWCYRRTLKNTRRAKNCTALYYLCLVLEFSTPMVCSLPAFAGHFLTLSRRRAVEVSGRNKTAHVAFADVPSRLHRSMTRPFFSKDRISDFELFDRHADQVISKMKERFEEGVAVDIQDIMYRFAMDTATEFLFGRNIKTLSGDLPYPSTCKKASPRIHPSDKFALAFNRAQENAFLRVIYGKLWPLVEFWEDIVTKDKNIVYEFTDPLIQAALEKKKAAKGVYEVDQDDSTLLDHLVHQIDGTRILFCCVLARQVPILCRFRHHSRRDLQHHVGRS